MKKIVVAIAIALSFLSLSHGATFEKYSEWKHRPQEKFADGEASFQLAMDKLLREYVDKGVSKEDLYRAATAGMLEALNSGDNAWNALLTPQELKEIQSDLSGQVSGIGIGLKFDEATGYAQILNVIPHSPSAKAGLKPDDQILSVDGKRYKGKQFRDIVAAIRGKIGDSISLKVLREDKIIGIKLKREVIPWTPVELTAIDPATQLLTIGYFTKETPKLVEEKMVSINAASVKSLIIDLRNNAGGDFEKAVGTAELFVPKSKTIVSTKDREGKLKSFVSNKGLLRKDIRVILLINKETSSGAELFTGALRDELAAKTLGEKTFGKWNAQTIQTLSNGFAIKYSVMEFLTPQGQSFQNIGITPHFPIPMPKGVDPGELRAKYDVVARINFDPQLKAAAEAAKGIWY